MVKSLTEKYFERIKIILSEFKLRPLTRTEIQIRYFRKVKNGNWSFDRTFFYLTANGHIAKCDLTFRSPYRLTEKGRSLLEGLS